MKNYTVLLVVLALCLGLGFGILIGMGLGGSPPVVEGTHSPISREPEHSQTLPTAERSDIGLGQGENLLDETSRKLRAQMATLEEENRVLNERNRQLTFELNKLQQELARKSPEQRTGRFTSSGTHTNAVARPGSVVRQAFSLSKGFGRQLADEIGLTEHQLATANVAIQRVWDRVKALELANAEIRQVSENEFAVKVNPFPHEAAQLRESLRSELRQILSLDQYREFEEKMGRQLDSPLAGFGEASREISIRVETSSPDGRKQYRITESSKSPGRGAGSDASSTVSLGFGGSASGGAGPGAITLQAVSAETTGGGGITQIRTMYVEEIPQEYRHFLPSESN